MSGLDDMVGRWPRNGTRVVYFLSSGGLIKIGSSRSLRGRIDALTIHSPVACRLVGFGLGPATRERYLHQRFAAQRAHGEWFVSSPAILSLIEATKRPSWKRLANDGRRWRASMVKDLAHEILRLMRRVEKRASTPQPTVSRRPTSRHSRQQVGAARQVGESATGDAHV